MITRSSIRQKPHSITQSSVASDSSGSSRLPPLFFSRPSLRSPTLFLKILAQRIDVPTGSALGRAAPCGVLLLTSRWPFPVSHTLFSGPANGIRSVSAATVPCDREFGPKSPPTSQCPLHSYLSSISSSITSNSTTSSSSSSTSSSFPHRYSLRSAR